MAKTLCKMSLQQAQLHMALRCSMWHNMWAHATLYLEWMATNLQLCQPDVEHQWTVVEWSFHPLNRIPELCHLTTENLGMLQAMLTSTVHAYFHWLKQLSFYFLHIFNSVVRYLPVTSSECSTNEANGINGLLTSHTKTELSRNCEQLK